MTALPAEKQPFVIEICSGIRYQSKNGKYKRKSLEWKTQ